MLLRQRQTEAAQRLLEQICSADHRDSESWCQLGILYARGGIWTKAAACFDHVLQRYPGHLDALYFAAECALERGRYKDAEMWCRNIIAVDAHYRDVNYALARALQGRGRMDEARHGYQAVLHRHPHHYQAWYNLGTIEQLQGNFDDASRAFVNALRCNPNYNLARYGLAVMALTRGDLREGWQHYIHRRAAGAGRDGTTVSLPADLTGRRILVHKDQGLGDELFFLRFAPALAARGARLTYRCDPRLMPFVAQLPAIDKAVTRRPDEVFDFEISAGDLPLLTDATNLLRLPASIRLTPDPARVRALRDDLCKRAPRPWLALTWQAGLQHALFKTIPLDALIDAIHDWPGTFISVQRSPAAADQQYLAQRLRHRWLDRSNLNDHLEDMLALMSLVDEYVAVSNTNIHLRAAVADSARILIPFPPEWRWMDRNGPSPWFPRFPTYRQSASGSWHRALATLRADLIKTGL